MQALIHFYGEDVVAMEAYRSGKNEVITLSPEFLKQLSDAGNDWISKTAEAQKGEGNEKMAEILDDYMAFKTLWESESSYLIRNQK